MKENLGNVIYLVCFGLVAEQHQKNLAWNTCNQGFSKFCSPRSHCVRSGDSRTNDTQVLVVAFSLHFVQFGLRPKVSCN